MTNRIQELAEWAGYNGHYATEEFDVDEFARLIVLKCAELVAGVPTDTLGYHTADQKIKDHFGVEE